MPLSCRCDNFFHKLQQQYWVKKQKQSTNTKGAAQASDAHQSICAKTPNSLPDLTKANFRRNLEQKQHKETAVDNISCNLKTADKDFYQSKKKSYIPPTSAPKVPVKPEKDEPVLSNDGIWLDEESSDDEEEAEDENSEDEEELTDIPLNTNNESNNNNNKFFGPLTYIEALLDALEEDPATFTIDDKKSIEDCIKKYPEAIEALQFDCLTLKQVLEEIVGQSFYDRFIKKFADTCLICLKDLSSDYTLLPCDDQRYHEVCIKTWVKKRSICPVCREDVTEEDLTTVSADSSGDDTGT